MRMSRYANYAGQAKKFSAIIICGFVAENAGEFHQCGRE